MLLIQSILALTFAAQIPEGALTVVAEPGALVVWDGVELGRTDSRGRLDIGGIPLGDYDVAISKEGFETARRRIEVATGHRDATFRLAPIRAAVPRPQPQPPASPPESAVLKTRLEAKAAGVAAIELPSAGARELKASQVLDARHSDLWWVWLLPLVGLAAAVLFWLTRTEPRAAAPGPEWGAPGFRGPLDFAEEPAPRTKTSAVSFLDDLRRREAMADRGVDLPPEDENAEVAIDLDENDVRSLDESAFAEAASDGSSAGGSMRAKAKENGPEGNR